MNILVAEDDSICRRLLESTLTKWGYRVITAKDGMDALHILQSGNPVPDLAILDVMMPGMNGFELCGEIRKSSDMNLIYIIILTALNTQKDIIEGLHAGADDYMTKPFYREELRARLQAGIRILELQHKLLNRMKDLEFAQSQIKQLQGLLPICSYCKRIRNDDNYWQQVETYISQYANVIFNHCICPECYRKFVEPEIQELARHLQRKK
jgi:sigma-B regulation protein RsbU (phosphoserine phosphatase)